MPAGARASADTNGARQGAVGLYARVSGPESVVAALPYCASVVDVEPPPAGKPYMGTTIKSLGETYPLPYVPGGDATASYGCPCYSSVRFDAIGQARPAPARPRPAQSASRPRQPAAAHGRAGPRPAPAPPSAVAPLSMGAGCVGGAACGRRSGCRRLRAVDMRHGPACGDGGRRAGQVLDAGLSHCSVAIDSGGVPLGYVPVVGNRFIAIEGRLPDIIAALSNVTYVPDPYFNTGLPGNEEWIEVSINDQVRHTRCSRQVWSRLRPAP